MLKFSSQDTFNNTIQELLNSEIKFATPISHVLSNLDYEKIYIQIIDTVAIWGYLADLSEEELNKLELI